MSENNLNRALLISAIPALLLMGFLFDYATSALAQMNQGGAGYEPLLVWMYPVFELVVVLGGMGVAWYMVRADIRSKAVAIPALVVGLIIILATPVLFFWGPMNLYFLVQYVQPGTFLFAAGGLLTGIGVFGLLARPAPAQ